MKTNKNTWVLQHKLTGEIYPNFTYKSRESSRKAAKGHRFKSLFKPVKQARAHIKPPMYKNWKKNQKKTMTKKITRNSVAKVKKMRDIAKAAPINKVKQMRHVFQ